MPATSPDTAKKEELTGRAQLVRMFEALCQIDFPTDDERALRLAVGKKLGLEFKLKEMRNVTIDGTPARK